MPPQPTRRTVLQLAGTSALVPLTAALRQPSPPSSPTRPTRPSSPATTQAAGAGADALSRMTRLAAASPLAAYPWLNRGKAPTGYLSGMAVSYARLHHALTKLPQLPPDPLSPYALEIARPLTPESDPAKDALQHYLPLFQQAGLTLSPTSTPAETLQHLFTLLLGLGMRESSGRHCEGRDRSAKNTSAETAEAGLFQTSYNARRAHPLLPQLFTLFQTNPATTPTYLSLFQQGVTPKPTDLENFGEGPGQAFQHLSKTSPFFATTFTALALRHLRKHWGPINRQAAEIKPEALTLFQQIQTLVDRDHLGALL